MRISRIAFYKVIEFDKGILILDSNEKMMNRPDALELVTGDIKGIVEYLPRYLHARQFTDDVRNAHRQALRGAGVKLGALDQQGAPDVPPVKTS